MQNQNTSHTNTNHREPRGKTLLCPVTGPPPQAAAPTAHKAAAPEIVLPPASPVVVPVTLHTSAPTLPAHEIVPEENPKSTAAPPPSATVEDQVSESHSLGM